MLTLMFLVAPGTSSGNVTGIPGGAGWPSENSISSITNSFRWSAGWFRHDSAHILRGKDVIRSGGLQGRRPPPCLALWATPAATHWSQRSAPPLPRLHPGPSELHLVRPARLDIAARTTAAFTANERPVDSAARIASRDLTSGSWSSSSLRRLAWTRIRLAQARSSRLRGRKISRSEDAACRARRRSGSIQRRRWPRPSIGSQIGSQRSRAAGESADARSMTWETWWS